MPYARVALLSPPYATLTYSLPPFFPEEFWRAGLRVAIPLGKGRSLALRAAVLLEVRETADVPSGVVCKEVFWPLETEPLLPADLLRLVADLALRQGVEPGHVLGHVLPQGLRSTGVRLRRLGDRAETLALRDLRQARKERLAELAAELLAGTARLLPRCADAASEEYCHLRVEPPWPVRPGAKRQIAILEFLHARGPVSRRRLLREQKDAAPALVALLRAGHVAIVRGDMEGEEPGASLLAPAPERVCLNADQQAALGALTAALDAESAQNRLLYGVTGSGKTAVYLELAERALARGRSVLLLAPEVALALKLRRDAARALPDVPHILYHGYQSPGRREAAFRALAESTRPCLVVGTRSALFLPVPQLGCIILDEEHDASFKQEEGLSYQAREVAWFRMRGARGLLVLGSATPDLKTFHAASSGRLPVLRLAERVGGRPLPPVELVDISASPRLFPDQDAAPAAGILASQCEAALSETLARGEQAVVLLNRRGYAPLMYCLSCGKTQRCPHCDIGLTYHKGLERLVCHYCGYSRPFPSPCDQCRGMEFLPLGEGTERLAERLSVIAGQPVLRLDRDSTRRPGRMEEILEAFARRESPILVGTQMLSKGHHFPQVTLAIVADGDLGLNLPDYRAAERTFQLLVQSAGRAGRGEKPGRVLIQTRATNHYCWQYVQNADYEGFYAAELALREKRRYPPFVRLGLLRLSYAADEPRGGAALGELASALRAQAAKLGVAMLGPAPAPLGLLRGRKRFQCLLKAEAWPPVRELYFFAKSRNPPFLRLSLDLDPVNML
ncbi:primosomal protein N' [Desulfovibrio sp.]|uniref:replication restart helicase PriA n=1 Tax=Desulfovibrio sp. TaxID=885 RepID=UPI0023D38321|nr:primosomal protein N' [Desulfovibrio sp.]MDE7242107.1 primosomal protein N' [Desulfovibrio sp.]